MEVRRGAASGPSIGEEEIADIVSMWTGIPVFKLTEAETQKLMRMEEELHKRVIGQDAGDRGRLEGDPPLPRRAQGPEAPDRLVHLPRPLRRRQDRAGPHARRVPVRRRGRDGPDRHVRVHGEARRVAGWSARRPATSATTRAASSPRRCGASRTRVLLLDEIEKAHPDVFNILLQILEDGRLTDAQGRTVDFRNAIVIMTSNIGASGHRPQHAARLLGHATRPGMTYDDMKNRIMGELKKVFRPEFLNRIDEVIVFHKLSRRTRSRRSSSCCSAASATQMAERELQLELTEEAKDLLVEKGWDPSMGARPLRRAIQRYIEDPLADEVLKAGPDRSTSGYDRAGLARRDRRRRRSAAEAGADPADEARARRADEGEKQQPVAVGAKGADEDEPAEEPAGEDRDAGSEAAE